MAPKKKVKWDQQITIRHSQDILLKWCCMQGVKALKFGNKKNFQRFQIDGIIYCGFLKKTVLYNISDLRAHQTIIFGEFL